MRWCLALAVVTWAACFVDVNRFSPGETGAGGQSTGGAGTSTTTTISTGGESGVGGSTGGAGGTGGAPPETATWCPDNPTFVDYFDRTVPNSWGEAAPGPGVYTYVPNPNRFSVVSGNGEVAVNANGQFRATVGGIVFNSVESEAEVLFSTYPATGPAVYATLSHYDAGGNRWELRLRYVPQNDALELQMVDVAPNNGTEIQRVVLDSRPVPGRSYRFRFRVDTSMGGYKLQGMAWDAQDDPPANWIIDANPITVPGGTVFGFGAGAVDGVVPNVVVRFEEVRMCTPP